MTGPEEPHAVGRAPTFGRFGRDFRLYASGQLVSVLGDRIAVIALVFLVIHMAHAYPPALALFYICRVVPTLLVGLLAGVIADRFRRQRLMVGCDLGRALLLVAIPSVTSLGLWTLYPMVVVLYTLTLLFDTAARAALPDVVPEGQMTGANAVLRGIETGADVAYAVGGAMVFVLGFRAPFYVDAATFLFSALMISRMRMKAGEPGPFPDLSETLVLIKQGIDYLLRNPFLKWSTLAFTCAPFAGGVIFVLTPLYANRSLARSSGLVGPLSSGAFRFSVLEVGLGAGALVGSAVLPALAKRWPRGRLFGLGLTGAGLAYSLFAFIANMYVATAVMVIFGVFNSLFLISGMTLVQALTPSEVRGRVVAARLTVINAALAAGSAVGGVLLLKLPYADLWLIMGSIIVVSSLFVWLKPEVRSQP